jgi:hypothetical protein
MKDLDKKIDKIKTESLADGGRFAFGDIPVRKFYDQAQYIEKTLLPAIERKSGDKSADFQFFSDTYKCLLYGAIMIDRNDMLMRKVQQLKQQLDILQARVDLAERELFKYITLEDLVLTESTDKIAKSVIAKIENSLKEK